MTRWRFRIILINRMCFHPRFHWRKGMWKRRGIGFYRKRDALKETTHSEYAPGSGYNDDPVTGQ